MRVFTLFLCSAFAIILNAQTLQFSDRIAINRNSAEVGVGDFDKDGYVDIAICNSEQRWYAGPDFTTWYKIGDSEGGPYAARVADINNDGWDDFITSDGTRTQADVDDMPGELYVYLNPGGSGGDPKQEWTRVLVYSGNVRHQNDLRIADMDGDGRLDIIERTWSSERVLVAMQNANINTWTTRVFDTGETGQPEGISAGDIDGDGEMEIVLSGVYWDNPGGWRTGAYTEHLIDAEFIQEEVKSAVGDIDGDGDNDVYMGSAEKAYKFLAWYEHDSINPATGGVVFIKHLIEDDIGNCHMVELLDVDKDGDLDLCTSQSFGDSGCLIYYNSGDGNSWTKQDYDPDGKLYTGVVRDLDKDGDLDIVGPSGFYSKVYYYLNTTPGDPPDPPSDLSLTLLNGLDVQLDWQDNSDDEGTFEIERFSSGNWVSIGNVLSDETMFIDDVTEAESTYRYRIYASNFAGNSDTITSGDISTWPFAGEVTLSPSGGNYLVAQQISMSAETPFDDIRYTTDGSTPDGSSTIYTGSFLVESSTTIKAISTGAGLLTSPEKIEVYNIAINGNFPPIADAGPDQMLNAITNVILDGSNSSDIDDQLTLIYSWEQYLGPSVSLNNAGVSIANFTPTEAATYCFELKVEDELVEDKDSVCVVVNDLSEDLVAYWPLDESMGNAMELVANKDAIVSSGISYLPNQGQVDGAFQFDGSSLTRALAPSINIPGSELTITFWMKADNLSSVEGRMISKADGASGNNHMWMVSLNGGSALRFRLKTSESSNTTTLISNTGQIVADEWYFVAAWYDGTSMKIFKDLTEIASTGKTGTITSADIPIAIGNQPTTEGDRPFPGILDDVRIYRKALSSQELLDIYNEACPNYILVEDETIASNMTLTSGNILELSNVTISEDVELTMRSLEVILGQGILLENNAVLRVIEDAGCQN